MRARKSVTIVCADEKKCSLRALVLDCNGYRVYRAASIAELLDGGAGACAQMAAVLIEEPCPDLTPRALGRIRALASGVRSLVVWNTQVEAMAESDAWLGPEHNSSREVLDRLRLLVVRKRGPRRAVGVEPVRVSA